MINEIKDYNEINHKKIIDQIRCLGIDMINEAKSGHPGIVLGAAPALYALYANHLRFDPKNPNFFNRDRFIMSAGHGSALLYAVLYMAGFDITIDDLKNFRQLDSITPGHPEFGVTPGVDCTTGPLGQGFATAVGVAMAEANLRSRYNKEKDALIDYYTYVLCGDGDLMEGISYEAASLAGTLKLNKLIVLYDSNNICLDGNITDTFNDNVAMRFVSQGWNVITVEDGDSFEMISGTNGLLGAADGAFIMQKKKRTDNIAVLDIAGRDQPDQKLTIEFDREHCIWNFKKAETELWKEPINPLLEAINLLLTKENPEWQGTATELVEKLPDMQIQANVVTRKLNVLNSRLLQEYGIQYENKRGHERKICLKRVADGKE